MANLALQIFTKNPPSDPSPAHKYKVGSSVRSASRTSFLCFLTPIVFFPQCPKCRFGGVQDWQTQCTECGVKLGACTVTGRTLLEKRLYTCRMCRHQAFDHELRGISNCPMCHTVLL
jgi:hypothetical protein